jgi:hypothetical protein
MQDMPNYKYTLPDDRIGVQYMAYVLGFHLVVDDFFRWRPPGAPLPKFPAVELPAIVDDEESMAEHICDMYLDAITKKGQGQLTTNSPVLFRSLFVPAWIDGYNFALFACAQGLIALEYPLSYEQRIDLAFSFACERFTDLCETPTDVEVAAALDELNVIFKDYQPFLRLEV